MRQRWTHCDSCLQTEAKPCAERQHMAAAPCTEHAQQCKTTPIGHATLHSTEEHAALPLHGKNIPNDNARQTTKLRLKVEPKERRAQTRHEIWNSIHRMKMHVWFACKTCSVHLQEDGTRGDFLGEHILKHKFQCFAAEQNSS
eukprot:1841196-Amphidinium_carterae.1